MGSAWIEHPPASSWKAPGRALSTLRSRSPGSGLGGSSVAAVLVLLLATAAAAVGVGIVLYTQLRLAESAGARATARSSELEAEARGLGTKLEDAERRERRLAASVDDLSARQRARDALLAERAATLDVLQTLLLPLARSGDATLREQPDALEVYLTERALFIPETSRLSTPGARLLRHIGDGLADTRFRVEVTGRAPSLLTGSLEEGAERARLAAERAAWVATFLVRRGGVPEDRVVAGVYGALGLGRRPAEPPGVRRSAIGLRLLSVPPADAERTARAPSPTRPSRP